MGRATDTLQKIQDEIQKDPTALGYAGLDPAAQAILLDTPISQNPPVFIQVPVIPSITDLIDILKAKGVISDADLPKPLTVEVKVSRSDQLGLGTIQQGDVEQAKLAPVVGVDVIL